jgi:predicted MFS family arabinose efflux permease
MVVLLVALPIGSGGALGILAAISPEWRVPAGTVALVNGVLGGFAALIGAVAGGPFYDRFNRQVAYCFSGLVLAAIAVLMAVLPRTPTAFVACTLAYSAVVGACYAGYSATVLETAGQGAAATKINVFASVANIPIALMTVVDGYIHDKWGTTGMLCSEAGAAIISVASFVLLLGAVSDDGKKRSGGTPWNLARQKGR